MVRVTVARACVGRMAAPSGRAVARRLARRWPGRTARCRSRPARARSARWRTCRSPGLQPACNGGADDRCVQDDRIPGGCRGADVGWPRWPRPRSGRHLDRPVHGHGRLDGDAGPGGRGGLRPRPGRPRPAGCCARWRRTRGRRQVDRRRRDGRVRGDGVSVSAARRRSRTRSPTTTARPATASRLRVGISVGDAVVDGGDLQGTAVVEAARLCAVAEPGTVLCSEAVRSVSANRSGCVFGEPRSVDLKGLPVPVVVHEVVSGPSADRADGHGLSFGVLGPLEVERDGRAVAVGGPKERLVLAVLLAGAGTVVSVDALVDAVWGERPPRTAERTIQAYIARLRRALEPRHRPGGTPTVIVTVGSRLPAGRRRRTARRETVRSAGSLAGPSSCEAGDAVARGQALRAALALWRGDAYDGFGDVGLRCRGARLDELRLTDGRGQGRRRPRRGQTDGAGGGARGRGGRHPFREHGCGVSSWSPCTDRVVSATPSPPTSGPGACWSTSWGSSRAQSCAAWRRRSSTRTPTSTGRPAGPGRRPECVPARARPPSARPSWVGTPRWRGCGRRGRPRRGRRRLRVGARPRGHRQDRALIAELAREVHDDGAARALRTV